MPESNFGELPPAPEKKPPSWIPEDLHEFWGKLNVQPDDNTFGESANPTQRETALKVLTRMKHVEKWPAIAEIRQGKGELPPEMVQEVLDLDGKKHGFGTDWQLAILRHPKLDIKTEDLSKIALNRNLQSNVRAEAWVNPKADPNLPLPQELVAMNFVGPTLFPKAKALPDDKLAQIIHNSIIDDSTKADRHSYDTNQFVRGLFDAGYGTNRIPNIDGKTHPLTFDAIIQHPDFKIKGFAAERGDLTDAQMNHLVGSVQPTLDGHPVTDEQIKDLNRNIANEELPAEEYNRLELLQDKFYRENKNKDGLLRGLANNKHLPSKHVDTLANVAQRAIEANGDMHSYERSILVKVAGHPNISTHKQFELLSDPYTFIDKVQKDYGIERGDYGNDFHEQVMKPDVFNDHFPAMLQHFVEDNDSASSYLTSLLEHPHLSEENIRFTRALQKKQLEEKGTSAISSHDFMHHENTPEDVKRDLWNSIFNPTEKEKERLRFHEDEGRNKRWMQERATRFGADLLRDEKLSPDFVTDIVNKADIINAELPSLKDEHHKIMWQKAKDDLFFGGGAEYAIKSVARHTKNPDLIREIHKYRKTEDWDHHELPKMFRNPDLADRHLKRQVNDSLAPFKENPYTPTDVIKQIHEDFPIPDLMEHQNFPQERIEEFANLPDNKELSIHEEANRNHARDKLKDLDPDNYSYKIGGPGTNLKYTPEDATHPVQAARGQKGKDFGRVEIKPGLSKLRVFRDKILEADPQKGELSPKQLGQGPFGGNWKPVQEKNGNISAKKIQELIDSHPSTAFNFAHEQWNGAQRHSRHPQRVFKLNVTTDHIKQMKAAGVYDAFKRLSRYSEDSGHPSDAGHTLGWVRYEHHQSPETKAKEQHQKDKRLLENLEAHRDENAPPQDGSEEKSHDTVKDEPEHIHVDEIQSDMGPNLIAKLKEDPERARSLGVDPDHIEKVHHIIFGKHHPSEVLMEAFREHHRQQGRHNIPIHVLDAKTKAPISGQEVDDPKKPLPAHMQFTYNQMPKKMGFQPNQYGATAQQDGNHKGAIWSDKIRKFEEELINKAIADIKIGKETHLLPRSKQAKLPVHVGSGRRNLFDYNHLLTPEHKKEGYQLYINHVPDAKIHAKLFHRGGYLGDVEGIINPYNGEKLKITSASISDDPQNPQHRGKGLGTAMYEAVLAHARHVGIHTVHGSSHSSMAHAVHNKLAAKHGLAYRALPNYMEGSYQHWEDKDSWDAAESGPFDDKWGGYEYMIKKETEHNPFRAAGFKHKETGQVIETGSIHDVGILPEEYDQEKWIDGFIDFHGTFHDREQAKKLVAKASLKRHEEYVALIDLAKSEDGIIAMLEQDDPEERILALKSAKVLPHHILIAINDVDPNVRAFAATHPLINGPLLTECLRQCKSPDTFNLLLGHESCDDSHMNYALETDWGGNGGFSDDDEVA